LFKIYFCITHLRQSIYFLPLKDGKPGVKDVSAYLQWIRKEMRHWMKTGEILAMAVTHARMLRVRARLPYPIGPPDVFAIAVSVVARAA